jgi:hypothetical protein
MKVKQNNKQAAIRETRQRLQKIMIYQALAQDTRALEILQETEAILKSKLRSLTEDQKRAQ